MVSRWWSDCAGYPWWRGRTGWVSCRDCNDSAACINCVALSSLGTDMRFPRPRAGQVTPPMRITGASKVGRQSGPAKWAGGGRQRPAAAGTASARLRLSLRSEIAGSSESAKVGRISATLTASRGGDRSRAWWCMDTPLFDGWSPKNRHKSLVPNNVSMRVLDRVQPLRRRIPVSISGGCTSRRGPEMNNLLRLFISVTEVNRCD